MALEKQIDTEYGNSASYWRVGIVNNHPINGTCSVIMYGYINNTTRQDGKQPIDKFEMHFLNNQVGDGSVTEIYNLVKLDDRFVGAVDV